MLDADQIDAFRELAEDRPQRKAPPARPPPARPPPARPNGDRRGGGQGQAVRVVTLPG